MYMANSPIDYETFNIRLTGPTPLPPQVRVVLSKQILSHRSHDFSHYLENCLEKLKALIGTKQTPMVLTCSGTGGLEAAIINSFTTNSTILSLNSGYFSCRFANIARTLGIKVFSWDIPWGRAIEADKLRKKIRELPHLDGILLTHNESSTGILNSLKEIAKVVREETNALLLVDGVTSVGSTPIEMDTCGIDIIVTASQKALMSPPGLAIIAASNRVLNNEKCISSNYFSFKALQQAMLKGCTPFTPAIHSVVAMSTALNLIEEECYRNVYRRHEEISKFCRQQLEDLGLKCMAQQGYESPTVSAFLLPALWKSTEVQSELFKKKVLISKGHGEYENQVIRIGHMGYVNLQEIKSLSESIRSMLLCRS